MHVQQISAWIMQVLYKDTTLGNKLLQYERWGLWKAQVSFHQPATILQEYYNSMRYRRYLSLILWQMDWLSVQFKIAVMLFHCLSGYELMYLANNCQLISDVSIHRLCSTDTPMCVVRHSQNSFDDWCFATAGPVGQDHHACGTMTMLQSWGV